MIIHVVKSGETLWKIANYYEADINEIIRINTIVDSNLILEGQALLIPSSGVLYRVKYKDTLWEIARKFKVSIEELISLNKIVNPNVIYPGITLILPQTRKPAAEVNAYTYVYGESDIQILKNFVRNLTYLTPFTYIVRDDGRLSSIYDEPAIQYAIANNVIPVMSISNFSPFEINNHISKDILKDRQLMELLIDNILFIMKEKNYSGINVNFQNILPEEKEAYNNFLHMLDSKLNENGYFISSSLGPYFDEEEKLVFNHDIEALRNIIDYLIVWTNDYYKNNKSPKALSPVDKTEEMLDFLTSIVPSDKILLGFPIYAKDWIVPYDGNEPQTINMKVAMARAYRNKAKIEYDETVQAPFFNYLDAQNRMHEVWFEDARSIQAKFDLVKKYKLRGISYWTLDYAFSQAWDLLKDNFVIVKD